MTLVPILFQDICYIKAPCEVGDEDIDGTPFEPLVSVIAGHIDESENLTHVDFVPLYYVGHASPLAGICVYHAHIPDPLEGGSPRVTDIDLVNYFLILLLHSMLEMQ